MQSGRVRRWIVAGCLLVTLVAQPEQPASASGATREVLTIGDSLTFGALQYQSPAFIGAGWTSSHVSAHGSRGIATKVDNDPYTGLTAVDALRENFGDSPEWVVALGTNDSRLHEPAQYAGLIRTMMDRIGRGRRVVWVNLYLPYEPRRMMSWNAALATVAAERPLELFVMDWALVAAEHPEWLTPDGIHYTAAGYRARAFAVAFGARALFDAARSSAVPGRPSRRAPARPAQGLSYST